LKEVGNALYKDKRYVEAFNAYTEANEVDPTNATILCNRAQVNLDLGMYGQACSDCIRVITCMETSPDIMAKAYRRLVKGFVGLNNFEAARQNLETLVLQCGEEKYLMDAPAMYTYIQQAEDKKKKEVEKEMKESSLFVLNAHGKAGEKTRSDREQLMRQALRQGKIKRRLKAHERHPEFENEDIKLMPIGTGFGIFAKRNIPAGTQILVDSTIVSVHLDPTKCHHCVKPAAKVRCSNDKCNRMFCSLECLHKANSLYHKALCGRDMHPIESFVALGKTASSRFGLVAAKLLGIALQQRSPGEMFLRNAPADCFPANLLQRAYDDWEWPDNALQTWDMFRMMFSDDPFIQVDPNLDLEWLLNVFAALSTNTVGLFNPKYPNDLLQYGQGLMMWGSFFNHSCIPNTMYQTNIDEGSNVRFVTTEEVKADEELTISYVDQSTPYESRRGALKGQYGFSCECPKCKREGKKSVIVDYIKHHQNNYCPISSTRRLRKCSMNSVKTRKTQKPRRKVDNNLTRKLH